MAVQASTLGLDCHLCSEQEKINYGCLAPPTNLSKWEFEGEFLIRCPRKLITTNTIQISKWYMFYKKGLLFNAGTIAHQPATMIEAFKIIESELNKLDDEEFKKCQQKKN